MNFKERETPQKLRGGYYTPLPIAELLSRWVLAQGGTTLLEPSCGDGVFLQALYAQVAGRTPAPRFSIEAVEIVAEEAAKSERVSAQLRTLGIEAQVIREDIFSWLSRAPQAVPPARVKARVASVRHGHAADAQESGPGAGQAGRRWDAILGNPPYIRYQYFEREQRALAERLFQHAGVSFSKRTNAWASLVLACVMHLTPGGSLALVLPAELLHIQHASGLRQFLEQEMETITLINIREMVFPDVLQGIVLLLARKKRSEDVQSRSQPASIRLLELDTLASLSTLSLHQLEVSTPQSISETNGEWMLGLLSPEEAALLNRLRGHRAVQPFVELASVDIGVVTGANDFFVVNQQTLERFELAAVASPMLAKSDLMKGIIYTRSDHEANREAGKAVFLLQFPPRALADLPASMAAYIREGEAQELHRRYKCRIRSPWYVVPYIWASELSLLKRCHLFPRLIVNELGAHSTDTAYRIRLHAATGERARDLAFSFLNSLTFLCAELGGRHYGGGVLELVPSEIEKLLIPLQSVDEQTFARVDSMIRRRASLDELLAVTDPLILGLGLGLTRQEIQTLQNAQRRLLKRRLRV